MKKTVIFLIPLLLVNGCASGRVRHVEPLESVILAAAPPAPGGDTGPAGAGPGDARRPGTVVQRRPAMPVAEPSSSPAPRFTPPEGPAPAARPAVRPAVRPEAPPAASSSDADEQYISLNFDNADIGVVVQTIAELIGMNYLVAPGVGGRVTIQSSSKIPVSALFTVLEEILEVNSLSAVKSGGFYKIVPTNQARQKDIETVVERAEDLPPGQRIVTQVVPLDFMRPSEVVKILNPLKSPGGLYLAHDPTKILFLTDTSNKIGEMMKIVAMLDVDTFARINVELYPVKYVDVDSLAKDLTAIVSAIYASSGRGKAAFRIIPVGQINALMIISAESGLARNIISWVSKMDQPSAGATEQIFVYKLAHAKAEEIAGVLTQIFKDSGTTARGGPGEPAASPGQPSTRTQGGRATARSSRPSTTLSTGSAMGQATIVADKATNSLIVQTSPWYYPVVEETIRKLDVLPKQVLIEVLIAEITLDDETQFGLQWVTKGQGSAKVGGERHSFTSELQNVFPPEGGTGLLAPATGFSWVVTEANRISAVLNAYANDSRLNILSSPHIIALDNMEATINVGSEVPIVTTQTTETAGGTGITGTITNDVEYRNTGIILTVTPHINEDRYVTLEVRQEVSQAQTNTLGGTDSPIIRKRTAETTMVVKDNQSLVIGGLIEEQKDHSREGIPYLSRIPLLGYLFGTTVDTVSKTELVLLITPRVIANPTEGNEVSRMLKDRALTLKKGIDSFAAPPRGKE